MKYYDKFMSDQLAKNIDKYRKLRGISMETLAKSAGTSRGYLQELKSGKRRINIDMLNKLARVLGCNPPDLISTTSLRLVKVEGYVGAGAEIFPFEVESNFVVDDVEAPPGVDPDSIVAVIVRGDSMFPAYRDNDVIYYTKHCDYDPSCLRRECIVKVKEGAAFVKILKPGSKPGRFTLQSYNSPDIEDVKIEWACKVLWVKKAQ